MQNYNAHALYSVGYQLETLGQSFSQYTWETYDVHVPDDFLSLAAKSMAQLKLSKHTNVLYNLAKGMATPREDGSDSRIPTKCMPMVANFFVADEIRKVSIVLVLVRVLTHHCVGPCMSHGLSPVATDDVQSVRTEMGQAPPWFFVECFIYLSDTRGCCSWLTEAAHHAGVCYRNTYMTMICDFVFNLLVLFTGSGEHSCSQWENHTSRQCSKWGNTDIWHTGTMLLKGLVTVVTVKSSFVSIRPLSLMKLFELTLIRGGG